MDLFNNPMVESAKQKMTPEQLEEYKRVGEYMFKDMGKFHTEIQGAKLKAPKTEDLVAYALEAVKAGGDPKDLTDDELRGIIETYGEKWYEKYNLREDEVRKPNVTLATADQVLNDVKEKAKKMNLSRQQRRYLERQIEKEKRRKNK
jgi:hypothetical protein